MINFFYQCLEAEKVRKRSNEEAVKRIKQLAEKWDLELEIIQILDTQKITIRGPEENKEQFLNELTNVRKFRLCGTGNSIDEDNLKFIGATVGTAEWSDGDLIFHFLRSCNDYSTNAPVSAGISEHAIH